MDVHQKVVDQKVFVDLFRKERNIYLAKLNKK